MRTPRRSRCSAADRRRRPRSSWHDGEVRLPIVLLSLLVGCGASTSAPPELPPHLPTPSAARARLDVLLAAPGHERLDAVLAGVDATDPLAVLVAVEPLLDPRANEPLASLVAAQASAEAGMPLVARARVSDAIEVGFFDATLYALSMLGAELAGPRSLWRLPLRAATPADVETVLDRSELEGDARLVVADLAFATSHADVVLAALDDDSLGGHPDALRLRLTLAMEGEDFRLAHDEAMRLASSGTADADVARLVLTRLALYGAAHPDFDAPRAVHERLRREALVELEGITPGSVSSEAAIETRIVVARSFGDRETVRAAWATLPEPRRAFVGASIPVLVALAESGDPVPACQALEAARALAQRLADLAAAWPTEGTCLALAHFPSDLTHAAVDVTGDDGHWQTSIAWPSDADAQIAEWELLTRSQAAFDALPASFRESAAGARAAVDLALARAEYEETCSTWARTGLARAIDETRRNVATLTASLGDPPRCRP